MRIRNKKEFFKSIYFMFKLIASMLIELSLIICASSMLVTEGDTRMDFIVYTLFLLVAWVIKYLYWMLKWIFVEIRPLTNGGKKFNRFRIRRR